MGDPVNKLNPGSNSCTSTEETVDCDHPDQDVPDVSFPRPEDWPDGIRPLTTEEYNLRYIGAGHAGTMFSGALAGAYSATDPYHDYELPVGGIPEGSLMNEAVKNPTAGSDDAPATASGTENDVGWIATEFENPVTSYKLEAADGRILVGNVTHAGQERNPGYIGEFETRCASGVSFHVAGEGMTMKQSNSNPIARLMERSIWNEQLSQHLSNTLRE